MVAVTDTVFPRLLTATAALLVCAGLVACSSVPNVGQIVTPYKAEIVQGTVVAREQVQARRRARTGPVDPLASAPAFCGLAVDADSVYLTGTWSGRNALGGVTAESGEALLLASASPICMLNSVIAYI